VYDAAEHAFGGLLGGGDAVRTAPASRRRSSRRAAGATKGSVVHAEGREDFPGREHFEWIAGNALHDLAEQLKIDIAIPERVPRPLPRLLGDGHADGGVVAAPRRRQIEVRTQP